MEFFICVDINVNYLTVIGNNCLYYYVHVLNFPTILQNKGTATDSIFIGQTLHFFTFYLFSHWLSDHNAQCLIFKNFTKTKVMADTLNKTSHERDNYKFSRAII